MRFNNVEEIIAYKIAYEEFQNIKLSIDDAFNEAYEMYLMGLANLIGLKNAFSIFPIKYMSKFRMSNDPIDQELFISFMELKNKIHIQTRNLQNLKTALEEIKNDLNEACTLVMMDKTRENVDVLWEIFVSTTDKINAQIETFQNNSGIMHEIIKQL